MMLPDKGPFLSTQLSEEEMREVSETPHSQLLARAFNALSSELDTNGNSAQFQELRIVHARKLIAYWEGKRKHYLEAQRQGKVGVGGELIAGDERLTVFELGVYEDDEAQALSIHRRTRTEKDEVSIVADIHIGVDDFMRPPTIKSDITDPDEVTDISFKVVFRGGRISTFERTLVRMDPENNRPYIKDTRVIDCSIFGVDLQR